VRLAIVRPGGDRLAIAKAALDRIGKLVERTIYGSSSAPRFTTATQPAVGR